MDNLENEFKQLLNPDKERVIITNTPRASDKPGSRPITALLSERGKTHGDFTIHAGITQELKDTMRLYNEEKWRNVLTSPMRESLEMIAHKIGRILAGDPNFRDHWDDIAGYATLVAERCSK